MSLTKIKPGSLDVTQDYAFNQLTANTAVVGGVNLYQFANAAFTSANAAGSSATVTAAFSTANAAFEKANTPSGITYTAANSAPSSPKLGDQWYKIDQNIQFEYITDGTSNNWVDVTTPVLVSNYGVVDVSAAAFIKANAAFDAANNATDTWVRNAANSASSYANSSYLHANAAFVAANSTGANSFVTLGYPIGDYGLVTDTTTTIFGESILNTWDNSSIINTSYAYSANGIFSLDAGTIT